MRQPEPHHTTSHHTTPEAHSTDATATSQATSQAFSRADAGLARSQPSGQIKPKSAHEVGQQLQQKGKRPNGWVHNTPLPLRRLYKHPHEADEQTNAAGDGNAAHVLYAYLVPHEADGRARLGELVRHALQVERGPRLRRRLVPRARPHHNTDGGALMKNKTYTRARGVRHRARSDRATAWVHVRVVVGEHSRAGQSTILRMFDNSITHVTLFHEAQYFVGGAFVPGTRSSLPADRSRE